MSSLYLSVGIKWTWRRLFRVLCSLPKLWRCYDRMMGVLGCAKKHHVAGEPDEWIIDTEARRLVLREAAELHQYIFHGHKS